MTGLDFSNMPQYFDELTAMQGSGIDQINAEMRNGASAPFWDPSTGSMFTPYSMQQNANPASGTGTGTSGVGNYFTGAAGGTGGSYGGVPSSSTTGTSSGGTPAFSLNPTPTNGSGTTFGMVPGAIGAPPSIWQQEQAIPGMSAATTADVGNINSQLAGQLSPSTTDSLTDAAAARGVSLGQGGNTGLVNETLLKTLGLTEEQLQQEGANNYSNFLGVSGSQQQSPQLMADIASHNATLAAAPDPTLAAQEAISLGLGGSAKAGTPSNYTGNSSNSSDSFLNQLLQLLQGGQNPAGTSPAVGSTSGVGSAGGLSSIPSTAFTTPQGGLVTQDYINQGGSYFDPLLGIYTSAMNPANNNSDYGAGMSYDDMDNS